MATARERALKTLTKRDVAQLESSFDEVMIMASMTGDPEYANRELDTSEGEFDYQFASIRAMRCHQSLDENGVPDDASEPPPEFIAQHTSFQFRGMDYQAAFSETGLAPFAKTICRNQTGFDFAGAPLDQRGYEGMSLLDWAVECEDRAAFDALIAAGFDLDAPGLWENPPVVNSATEKRLWFLRGLLDAGANPDAMGRTETALTAATNELDASNSGGDTKAAFNLLRERGSSLNFPNYGESMWYQWGLHERHDGWASILKHWEEFDSDPVELASLAEAVLEGQLEWLKDQKADAAKVKALLISEHGVCFPVGRTFEMTKDERGFVIQPDCPKRR